MKGNTDESFPREGEKRVRTVRKTLHSIPGRMAVFLLAMLLALLLSVAWATRSSQTALQREIVAWNESQTSAALEQLMLSLDRTVALQQDLLFDSDINRLGVMPGYFNQPQKIRAMQRIMERMTQLTDSSPFVRNAAFLAPSIQRVIEGSEVNPLSDEEFMRLNDQYLARDQLFIEREGEFYIAMPYPAYHNTLKTIGASYMILVQVDRQAIAAFLSSHSAMKEEAAFLYEDGGRLICSAGESAASFDQAEVYRKAAGGSAFEMAGEQTYQASVARSGDAAPCLVLVRLQPSRKAFQELTAQRNIFLILSVLVVLATLVYMLHFWHVIYKPLNKLSRAFRQVEEGNFDLRVHHRREDDFAEIYERFNHMNERLGELIEQVYMQTIRTQRAELKQLQSQINPHFLYNNLFMIRSLAQLGDMDTIEELASDLGEYFRYLNRTGQQEVPLSMETDHARNYAQLQDLRFSSRIHLNFEPLPEEFAAVTVPRLILQPLIENAYQHGLKDVLSQGELHIGFQRDGQDVIVLVEDNGPGMTESTVQELNDSLSNPDVQETTGTINIHRRLRLRYGAPYGLQFSISPLGGLRVAMRIPIKNSN